MATLDLQTRTALTAADYLAKGDGATDDTAALQDMIDALETAFFAAYDAGDLFAYTFATRVPSGRYLLSAPLVISAPIIIEGASEFTTLFIPNSDFAPFEIRGFLSASSYITDNMHPTLRSLCILGGGTVTDTSQHGVYVKKEADRQVTRVWVDKCQIRSMGAAGIYSETAVSNKVTNSNIALCQGPGIDLTGQYNTDLHIFGNSIRRNLMGIRLQPDVGQVWSSGRITQNLIESNRNGTGQAGSATRPCVGIWMSRAQQIEVASNYFESHINGVYVEGNASYCHFHHNRHDGGDTLVPGYYTGFGGPARQVAPYYFDNAGGAGFSMGVTLESNWLYRPEKPAATADADWGTATWGSEYEHLPVLNCQQLELIRNKWINPDASIEGVDDILYNASDAHVHFEGVSRNSSAQTVRRSRGASYAYRESDRLFDVAQLSRTTEFTTTAQAGEVAYVAPVGLAGNTRVFATLKTREADDSLTTLGHAYYLNSATGFTFANDFGYGIEAAGGATILRHRTGTAAPTTGTHTVGSIYWNEAPSLDGNNMIILGWICRIAGTPGSWSPMYVSAVSPAT